MGGGGALIRALRMLLGMTLLTGIAYPMLITLITHLTMPKQSRGDLVIHEGEIIGSVKLGQNFQSPKYFWPRPSATHYQTLPAGGSNLGPTSGKLKALVEERKKKFSSEKKQIPEELLFASGSGLDPHITPQAASFQVERIAQARQVAPEKIRELIDKHVKEAQLGFLGEARVNVFLLNLALEKEFQHGGI
jgi:K+-transporting ATPase ATPase C chain